MKVVKQSFEILSEIIGDEILAIIEKAGRVCYKSEHKISAKSAYNFVENIIKRGHESVLEHASIMVRIITDRGISHEIVRHRIASYSQESTRYCNYSKDKFGNEITFILPCWFKDDELKPGNYNLDEIIKMQGTPDKSLKKQGKLKLSHELCWLNHMLLSERKYLELIKEYNWTPQQARSILPNSLKTELIMTMNVREWRHFFNLRTSSRAHPQMQELARPMLKKFKRKFPVVFNGIVYN